jgi:Copper type II ascorbate-dependent monooxygenase, C-terminal domain
MARPTFRLLRSCGAPARFRNAGDLVATLCAAVLLGCGSTEDGPAPPTGPTVLTGEKFTATWGPVRVPPGQENTQCAVLTLDNTAPIKVHQLRNVLGTASHHMIVYRDDASAEQVVPVDCSPFAGTLTATAATSPVMITQRQEETLTLPDGVAYSFGVHQKVRIEMHFLNATDQEQMITGVAEFYAAPPEQIRDEADFLFIGSPDIKLDPRSTAQVNAFFTPPPSLAGAKFFAITGHTHKYGTEMTVATAAARGAPPVSVYAPTPFVWSEPATVMQEPAFEVPPGGGFDFHCGYHNTSNRTVNFGESADDEMCFFWAYYYPSKGSRVCVHSTRVNAPDGVDVCCPADEGDALSQLVCSYLASSL